jgi:peptide/nickel transport system substrate-binding protein
MSERTMPKRRMLFVALAATAALVVGAGISDAHVTSTDQAAAPRKGGTLTLTWRYEPIPDFGPWTSTVNGTIWLDMQIFDQLVEQKPGSDNPAPALAASWDIAKNGLSYTFHLRHAKFSNGKPVTAQDVKFSLDHWRNPKVNANYAYLAKNVKKVTIVNPSTIRIDMKAIDASFFGSLTHFTASIVPKALAGAKGFGLHPVGSGPFMLKRWVRNQRVELVRNPEYWRAGKPYLDAVTILHIDDDNARILKARSGEADVAVGIPYSQVAALDKQKDVKVLIERSLSVYPVFLNHAMKPLDEKGVRQALNYATPKAVINKVALFGMGKIANSQLMQTTYWDPSIPPYPYDLARARKLIAQSSVPDGFTLPITFNATDVTGKQVAQILQAEWSKIGVKVELDPLDQAAAGEKFGGSKFGGLMQQPADITSDVPDPNQMGPLMLDYDAGLRSLFTNYKSPQAASLLKSGNATLDPKKRQKLYSQLQRLTLADAVNVPMLFAPYATAVSEKVHGFATLPTGWWLLQDVWLEK